MSVLRVWAPNAQGVAAMIGERRLAMEKEDTPRARMVAGGHARGSSGMRLCIRHR